MGQVVSGVGADQVGLGEQVVGRVVAGRPVADQVDVGAGVEAADQEGAGHAEQVGLTALDDARDDRQEVWPGACAGHTVGFGGDVGQDRAG